MHKTVVGETLLLNTALAGRTVLSLLQDLATVFRKACEQVEITGNDPFSYFPRGACGDASLVLAHFLRKHGFDGIEYINGAVAEENDRIQSHAWLEIDGTIVDITADQFSNYPGPPVLVTCDSSWHAHFHGQRRSRADIGAYDAFARARLLSIYRKVIEHVPEALRGAGA